MAPVLTALVVVCSILQATDAFTQHLPDTTVRHSLIRHVAPSVSLDGTSPSSPEVTESLSAQDKVVGDGNLSPVLQKMAVDRREFELNLGKAMDVLRHDYPEMLRRKPDFSIYHDDITAIDPSGVRLSGSQSYQNSFRFLQSIVGFLYNTDYSTVQSRMVYDFARSQIRVSWNAILVPKVVGNRKNSQYIDGISTYKMDGSGKIIEHTVDTLLMNNTPVQPPYGILSLLLNPQPADGRVHNGGGGICAISEN